MVRLTCFNSLVRYGPTLDYLPDLAESWENPDDRTYVFTLREGVTYHNGQAVEASHVEFSYKRIAEKNTVFSSRVANVAVYEVIDPRTIKLVLKAVQADFIDGLILLSIISPEIAEEIETTAIGTGPFKFVEWVPNDHITLERNPDYYEADVPGVETLTFQIIPEAQVAITNLQAGGVNGVLDVPVSQAAPLKEDAAISTLIVPTSSIHIFELHGQELGADPFERRRPPGDRPLPRQGRGPADRLRRRGAAEVVASSRPTPGPTRTCPGTTTTRRRPRRCWPKPASERPGVHRHRAPGLPRRRARLDDLAGRVGGGRASS